MLRRQEQTRRENAQGREKYLRPVQKSVFEGILTGGKLKQLKAEIEKLVDCEEDSIRIYKLHSLYGAQIVQLGVLSDAQGLIL